MISMPMWIEWRGRLDSELQPTQWRENGYTQMLLIRKKRRKLNTQRDSIRTKLFVWTVSDYYFIIYILLIHSHTPFLYM